MRRPQNPIFQRGVALVVGMTLLVIMTLTTLAAVKFSTANLKATTNMQFRDAALAAANVAIEQVVSTTFQNAPAQVTVNLAAAQYGAADYVVTVPAPQCNYWSQPTSLDPTDPDDLPCFVGSRISGIGGTTVFCADTIWEVRAPVSDTDTGANIVVNQGIATRMSATLARNSCD